MRQSARGISLGRINLMLVDNTEVLSRLESPDNLMNKLREITSSKDRNKLITPIPSLPSPKVDEIGIDSLDTKIDVSSGRSKALAVMAKALTRLENNVDAIDVKKLPDLVGRMAITVKNLEPTSQNEKMPLVQFLVYKPELMSESDFSSRVVGD